MIVVGQHTFFVLYCKFCVLTWQLWADVETCYKRKIAKVKVSKKKNIVLKVVTTFLCSALSDSSSSRNFPVKKFLNIDWDFVEAVVISKHELFLLLKCDLGTVLDTFAIIP